MQYERRIRRVPDLLDPVEVELRALAFIAWTDPTAIASESAPVSSRNLTAWGSVMAAPTCSGVTLSAVEHFAQFRLNRYAAGVCNADDLPGDANVIIKRQLRAVEHERSEAFAQAAHVLLQIGAVIEVEHDRDVHQAAAILTIPAVMLNPQYRMAPSPTCRITGDRSSCAASMIAWICSILLALNAPTAKRPAIASLNSCLLSTSGIE